MIDTEILRRNAAQAVGALKLQANEDRRRLCQRSQGELCVSALEEFFGIRQPTLSQQLGMLPAEGAVTTRRQGKNIYYRIADRAMLDIVAVLYRLYCPKENNDH